MNRLTQSVVGVVLLLLFGALPAAGSEGPHLVKDLRPGSGTAGIQTLVSVGDRVFFTADDFAVLGRELYVSDGTSNGTHLVKDVWPGPRGSLVVDSGGGNPNSLTALDDRLFFTARDGVNGLGLYVTDGTAAGTQRLAHRRPCDSASKTLVAVGGRLVFAAKDANGVCNLYKTDGTPEGTVGIAADIPTFRVPIAFNNHVFFAAGTESNQLWKTSGMPGGTTKRIRTFSAPIDETAVSGRTLFLSVSGRLWRSDGTGWGTRRVSPSLPLHVEFLTDVNGTLLFAASASEDFGRSLWRTRGGAESTRMIEDFGGDPHAGIPNSGILGGDNRVYFMAGVNLPGYGLWTSDGTRRGTGLLARIGAGGVTLGDQFYGGGCYYQEGSTDTVGCGRGPLFFTSDGTPEGTHQIEGAVGVYEAGVGGNQVFLNVSGDLWVYVP